MDGEEVRPRACSRRSRGVGDVLIEAIERRAFVVQESSVAGNRLQKAGGQRGIDAVKQLQEDQADRVTRGWQAIAAGARQLLDQAFGAQFGEIVAQGGQAVLLTAAAEGGD